MNSTINIFRLFSSLWTAEPRIEVGIRQDAWVSETTNYIDFFARITEYRLRTIFLWLFEPVTLITSLKWTARNDSGQINDQHLDPERWLLHYLSVVNETDNSCCKHINVQKIYHRDVHAHARLTGVDDCLKSQVKLEN